MSSRSTQVDTYIADASDFAQPVLTHLRELIHQVCPDVEEAWKWSFPNFMYKGAILCSMAAFKQHCSFGFWKASLMQDKDNILETKGRDGMGNLGKITSLKDLPKDAVLKRYIKEAMKLNEEGIKVVKRKPAEKKEIETPDYFEAVLERSPKAKAFFDAYSYSHRKEYIEWITGAKTEATRAKRMAQALQWLEEGKSRNWKY